MSVCPVCNEPILTGCTCGWITTEDFEASIGDSPEDIKLQPRIDPISGNLLVCGAGGLAATIAERYTNPPRVRVYNSVNNNIDVAEELTFNSEEYDSHGMHAPSSAFLIIPIDGIWKAGFSMRFAASAAGFRAIYMYQNRSGSVLNRFAWQKDNGRNSGNCLNREVEGFLKAGDVLSIEAISSGATVALVGGKASFAFWARWIGDKE